MHASNVNPDGCDCMSTQHVIRLVYIYMGSLQANLRVLIKCTGNTAKAVRIPVPVLGTQSMTRQSESFWRTQSSGYLGG